MLADLLWNDKDFCRQRALEQLDYISNTLSNEELSTERRIELLNSATTVFKRFEDRLKQLEKKSCKCGKI